MGATASVDFDTPVEFNTVVFPADQQKRISMLAGTVIINNTGSVTSTQTHAVYAKLTNSCTPRITIITRGVSNDVSWGGDWLTPVCIKRSTQVILGPLGQPSYTKSTTLLQETGVLAGSGKNTPPVFPPYGVTFVGHLNGASTQTEVWNTYDNIGNKIRTKVRYKIPGRLRPIAWCPIGAIDLGVANRRKSSLLIHPVIKPAPVFSKYLCFSEEETTGGVDSLEGGPEGTDLGMPNLFPLGERFSYLKDPQSPAIPTEARVTNEAGATNLVRYWIGRRNGNTTEYFSPLSTPLGFIDHTTPVYVGGPIFSKPNYGNHLLFNVPSCVQDKSHSLSFIDTGYLGSIAWFEGKPLFANSSIETIALPAGKSYGVWTESTTPITGFTGPVSRAVLAPQPPVWDLKVGSFSSCEQDTQENRRRVTTAGDTRVTTDGDERVVSL